MMLKSAETRVHFLGGADEVGASCLLVEAGGKRVLVDCGVRMGAAAKDRLPHLAPISDLGGLDAILVTHAHLDHSGALPLIHGFFPRVPVIMTAPTLSLLRVLLLDAIKVMAVKAEQEDEVPLYPQAAVEALLARAIGVQFLEPVPLCDGDFRATFFPAGHVLGAAAIGLETPSGSVLISGDVSLTDQLTVPGMPRPAFSPDLFVCESTYGGRLHASRHAEEARLASAVREVLSDGGKVLIPAFALGRAQEVILSLRKALAASDAPPATVWVDGMVRAINAVYGLHADALAPLLRDRANKGRGLFTTADGRVRDVRSPMERDEIVEGGPSVIVSSSGMLSGGPSSQYAARLVSREDVLIAITGYQDEEAPGRRLQELSEGKSKVINLSGETVPVRCRVATYGLSAHADAHELVGLAEALKPGAVALVHGDGEAREGLSLGLAERGIDAVHLPAAGDVVTVGRGTKKRPRRLVEGIGRGRPFDEDALAELHKQLWTEGRSARKPLSAHDLAERWFGSTEVPVDLTPIRELLSSGQRFFTADAKRPFWYRWVDPTITTARSTSPAEVRDEAGRLEQNAALALVDELLGADSDLVKRGADRESWTLRLVFNFPDVASQRFPEVFDELERRSGWAVRIKPEPNLAAFSDVVTRLLPEGITLAKPPSVRKEERRVKAQLTELPESEIQVEVSGRFEATTGFRLELEEGGSATKEARGDRRFDVEGRMEINLTFGAIDRAFTDQPHRPYKKSKRQDDKGLFIELSFVSPEVGLRFEDILDDLEDETGWDITISKKVDQQGVLSAVRELLPASWQLEKNPGLDVANRCVLLRLSSPPPEGEQERFSRELAERTGFELKLR